MAEQRSSLHGQWSSRIGFILAVAGSAIGLGNIWRFPYLAGEYGGGAFVLVYLVCVFAAGLPIMMSEILLGRRGRRNPVATMRLVGEEETGTIKWRWVGILGVAAGFLILSYYSVIAGWAMAYIFVGGSGAFMGADREAVGALFTRMSADPGTTSLWHSVFMGLTVFVVAFGVEEGLERAVRVLMPALVLLLLALLAYTVANGEFAVGLRFLFRPSFGDLTPRGMLEALGQAFFTLSVGMGAIMTYGAYLPNEESIARTSVAVVLVDTAITILVALVVFPIVFAHGVDPTIGPGLVFESLPLAFGQMPGGIYVAVSFFALVVFVAWTSAISLMEPAVTFFVEQLGFTRIVAALSVGLVVWALGFVTIVAFGPWSAVRFHDRSAFEWLVFVTNDLMLPLGGFAIVVFAGWFMAKNSTADELDPRAGTLFGVWRFCARFVAPVAILIVLLNATGLLDSLFFLFRT